jgi:hypothetical protein
VEDRETKRHCIHEDSQRTEEMKSERCSQVAVEERNEDESRTLKMPKTRGFRAGEDEERNLDRVGRLCVEGGMKKGSNCEVGRSR